MPSTQSSCNIYACGIEREFLNQEKCVSEPGAKGRTCGTAGGVLVCAVCGLSSSVVQGARQEGPALFSRDTRLGG